jgi:hypothetical protein
MRILTFYLQTVNWWALRVTFVQQRILDNPSATILNNLLEIIDLVTKDVESFQNDKSKWAQELRARFYLEVGFVNHFHSRDKLAKVRDIFFPFSQGHFVTHI